MEFDLDAAMDAAVNMHDEWLHSGRAEGFAEGEKKGSLEGYVLGKTHARAVAAEAGFMMGAALGVTSRLHLVPGTFYKGIQSFFPALR